MKALVIGATGLIGKEIVKQLLEDKRIDEVEIFVRRSCGIFHPKLKESFVDFEKDDWTGNLRGDIFFSALGTTLKDAGSKDKQYKIDHDYQLKAAVAASLNKVGSYVLISSVNADSKSSFFYLRMKGELEDKVRSLPFSSICILRPGPLKGQREVPRWNEKVSTAILDLLPHFLLPSSLKTVDGGKVAEIAVSRGLSDDKGLHILQPN